MQHVAQSADGQPAVCRRQPPSCHITPAFPALQLVILLLLAMQGATGALTPHEAELTWRLQVSRAGHPCTM